MRTVRTQCVTFRTTYLASRIEQDLEVGWPGELWQKCLPSAVLYALLANDKCRRVLFLDNCGGHNETRESAATLEKIVTGIRLLPKNSTHLTQPADSFVIQKIMQAWQQGWDAKKVEMIKDGDCKSGTHSSGKLKNPGYKFFLKLAAESVREVNKLRDKSGITYARKSMIRCGLSRDLNGVWCVK
jgi:DDE superfamily endonuclease